LWEKKEGLKKRKGLSLGKNKKNKRPRKKGL